MGANSKMNRRGFLLGAGAAGVMAATGAKAYTTEEHVEVSEKLAERAVEAAKSFIKNAPRKFADSLQDYNNCSDTLNLLQTDEWGEVAAALERNWNALNPEFRKYTQLYVSELQKADQGDENALLPDEGKPLLFNSASSPRAWLPKVLLRQVTPMSCWFL